MGRPKALLRCGPSGDTFVTRLVRTLQAGGVTEIIVVGRPDDGPLREEVQRFCPSCSYVTNPAPERGQLSSLLAGIDAAEHAGIDGALVIPVDTPLVTPRTIAAMLDAFSTSAAPIARATHADRHGHPVIFRRDVFDDLRAADPAIGAKAVLHSYADRVLNVDVPDPGVLRDVDEPQEYEKLFRRAPH